MLCFSPVCEGVILSPQSPEDASWPRGAGLKSLVSPEVGIAIGSCYLQQGCRVDPVGPEGWGGQGAQQSWVSALDSGGDEVAQVTLWGYVCPFKKCLDVG